MAKEKGPSYEQPKQKIIRIEFVINGSHYINDMRHDASKSDEENCDAAVKDFINTIKQPNATITVMEKISNENVSPVILLFNNVHKITIYSIGIFEVKGNGAK